MRRDQKVGSQLREFFCGAWEFANRRRDNRRFDCFLGYGRSQGAWASPPRITNTLGLVGHPPKGSCSCPGCGTRGTCHDTTGTCHLLAAAKQRPRVHALPHGRRTMASSNITSVKAVNALEMRTSSRLVPVLRLGFGVVTAGATLGVVIAGATLVLAVVHLGVI